MKKQAIYIILITAIISTFVSIVDMVISPTYIIKSIIKVCLFVIFPILYLIKYKKDLLDFNKLFKPNLKIIFRSLIMGCFLYIIIVVAYLLLKDYIDFSNITKSLTDGIDVNRDNFIFVAVYISFVNSLLEEFFFRGFAFMTLKKHLNKKSAYLFSAFCFAFYHIGMTFNWVAFPLFILGLIGLIVGGCLFNYLNEKNNSIYSSWFVHMFINFAINTIGCILFGLI